MELPFHLTFKYSLGDLTYGRLLAPSPYVNLGPKMFLGWKVNMEAVWFITRCATQGVKVAHREAWLGKVVHSGQDGYPIRLVGAGFGIAVSAFCLCQPV